MSTVNVKLNNIDELKAYGYDIMDKESALSNKIKELLEAKGLNQSDLSKLTGISRQNISDIIQNKLKPGVDFAIKIAKVLGVSVEELFQLNESAWYKIAKLEDDTSIFIDLFELKVIDNKERKKDLSNGALEYLLLDENKCVDEEVYNNLFKEYLNKNTDNKLTKKEVIRKFEDTICTKRYKKLVQRITPIINIQ